MLESKSYDPFHNLALDEYCFTIKKRGDTFILLWQNEKSVVIGRYQNPYEEINFDFARENNIKVARRNSGGGAVYQDLGNLNYSIIADFDPEYDIKRLSKPMITTLGNLGVNAQFQGRNDIYCGGYKISGNAQYTRSNKILHHGTLLVETDLAVLSEVLTSKTKFDDSSSSKSIKKKVCNLNSLLESKKVTIQQIKNEFSKYFGFLSLLCNGKIYKKLRTNTDQMSGFMERYQNVITHTKKSSSLEH